MPVESGDDDGEFALFPGLEGNGRFDWAGDCGFLQQSRNGDCGDWPQSSREEDELNGECAFLCGNPESERWRVMALSLRE